MCISENLKDVDNNNNDSNNDYNNIKVHIFTVQKSGKEIKRQYYYMKNIKTNVSGNEDKKMWWGDGKEEFWCRLKIHLYWNLCEI